MTKEKTEKVSFASAVFNDSEMSRLDKIAWLQEGSTLDEPYRSEAKEYLNRLEETLPILENEFIRGF